MAVTFPTTLDSLTNPLSTDTLNSPSHSDQHSDTNNAIEALEAKVGADSSAVTSSHDYKLAHLTAADITDITASADELNIMDGVTADKDEINLLDGKTTLDSTPTGAITMYGGSTAPTDWLLCDGSAVSRSTYASLFSAIGESYGVGDGSTTFNVPNLKGKVPVGYNSAEAEFDALGEVGGAKTHTLTTAEMPTHTHTQDAHTHTQNAHTHIQDPHKHGIRYKEGGGSGYATVEDGGTPYDQHDSFIYSTTATNQNTTATNQNTTATNQNAGSGSAHNNLQPYIVVNYIIKS
jgi:microcystin-dependent protein